jgi:glutathione S-transferase
MIRIVQPPRIWGQPNLSPPCMKLETWLRMVGIPYQAVPRDRDLGSAPKGKLPFIVEEDGTRMGDSTLIIEYLASKHGRDVDAGLTSEQRAISLAFRRMMKENLYWVAVYSRYTDERNTGVYRQMLLDSLHGIPEEHRIIAIDELQKSVRDQLQGHGIGRHTKEEVYRIGIQDLAAISDYLGDKPFFMGEKPTLVDATAYASVANIIGVPIESVVKDFGLSRGNLVRYCQRMRERFFPEMGAGPELESAMLASST